MSTKLYVGNLGYKVTDRELQDLFKKAGDVVSAEVVTKPMGFGFVIMKTPDEATKAIELLNGHDFQGRTIKVDHAKEKDSTPAIPAEPVATEKVVEPTTPVEPEVVQPSETVPEAPKDL